MNRIRVLVLDGPGRQVMPILQGLHDLKADITTVNYSRLDIGFASRYPHKRLICKENDFSFVDKEIKSGKYDVVIPLSDKMTFFLTKHWDEYKRFVKGSFPSFSTFMKAYDKQQTMDICQEIGIPCTISKRIGESLSDFLNRIGGFPIVIKPKSGNGSVGFHCIKSMDEFDEIVKREEINLDDTVIQEFVNQNGKQFNVHAFVDDNNNISFILPTQKCRWFPVDGGSSCYLRTIDDRELVSMCSKLLKFIKWRGYCEIELIEDTKTNEKKIMEINGRTSACIKICQLCKINVSKSIVQLALGEDVEDQNKEFRDARMRCIHTDLLWFLKSKQRFKTKPSWFNNFRTHDQIFSIRDPFPFFTFSLQSIFRYKKEMKRRKR